MRAHVSRWQNWLETGPLAVPDMVRKLAGVLRVHSLLRAHGLPAALLAQRAAATDLQCASGAAGWECGTGFRHFSGDTTSLPPAPCLCPGVGTPPGRGRASRTSRTSQGVPPCAAPGGPSPRALHFRVNLACRFRTFSLIDSPQCMSRNIHTCSSHAFHHSTLIHQASALF